MDHQGDEKGVEKTRHFTQGLYVTQFVWFDVQPFDDEIVVNGELNPEKNADGKSRNGQEGEIPVPLGKRVLKNFQALPSFCLNSSTSAQILIPKGLPFALLRIPDLYQ